MEFLLKLVCRLVGLAVENRVTPIIGLFAAASSESGRLVQLEEKVVCLHQHLSAVWAEMSPPQEEAMVSSRSAKMPSSVDHARAAYEEGRDVLSELWAFLTKPSDLLPVA
jgi:hypothetical protein